MSEEIIFNQCRALITNAEESLQRIENHAFKVTTDFEKRIAVLETEVAALRLRIERDHMMMIGQKFNRLRILRDDGVRVHARIHWACLCDCGNVKPVPLPTS